MVTECEVKAILMKMERNKYVTESWMIRHANCSSEMLQYMVKEGFLNKREKNAADFMSENKYCITDKGFNYAWNHKEGEEL